MKYVAYYRVSTTKQGQSGLGLEAQRNTVLNYIGNNELVGEFTEIESGKSNNRTELNNALDLAKKEQATLVIAKLDRLSRNLTFISTLMDNKVKFVAVDMPEANEFTIHIFAALAQQERKMISERTKNALAVIKQTYGTVHHKVGSAKNITKELIDKSLVVRKENAKNNPNNVLAKELIESYVKNGLKPIDMLKRIQKAGVKTSRGLEFKQVGQITRLIKELKKETK
jgi:DNA invertase Pin-like site-specific DNA recombinase